MLSALMFTVRSMRAALRSEERLSGPIRPQPKWISLGRDELPDHLLRELGIFDGNRSDRATCHPVATSCSSRWHAVNARCLWRQHDLNGSRSQTGVA